MADCLSYSGWTDNRSHFRDGKSREVGNQHEVTTVLGPVSTPWSVGLAEQVVRLALASLRRATIGQVERRSLPNGFILPLSIARGTGLL